jgi:hypothetical protein
LLSPLGSINPGCFFRRSQIGPEKVIPPVPARDTHTLLPQPEPQTVSALSDKTILPQFSAKDKNLVYNKGTKTFLNYK